MTFDLERARGLRDFLQDDCAEVGDVWEKYERPVDKVLVCCTEMREINALQEGRAMTAPHTQCCCPECVSARRAMLLRTHPIHARRDEDIAPTPIPVEQALAMRLEDREILRGMLAQVESDIRNLRDCA